MSEEGTFLVGLANEAGVRLLAVDATAAAEELRLRHQLLGHAARAGAEGLVAAQLLSAYIKGEERITMQVQMEKPRFAMIVDVNADGSTRGRFTPSHISRPRSMNGAMMVIKHDAKRELYRGVAPVEDTDFQGALQAYLVRSQQSVGVVRIDVLLSDDGAVLGARGLLLEKLPDQLTEIFMDLFGDLEDADLGGLLAGVLDAELLGFPVEVLDRRPLRFACTCSAERSLDVLASLGAADLRELLDEQGGAELTCNFCMETYHFDADAIESLARDLDAR
jgi:molecular chaperone Hsp33